MNSIYTIEDKFNLLNNIKTVAAQNCLLVIFEYTYDSSKGELPIKDFNNLPIHPIDIQNFPQLLSDTGWELVELEDISNSFISWYENLLTKLNEYKNNDPKDFSSEKIDEVIVLFNQILENFKSKKIGGALIVARKL